MRGRIRIRPKHGLNPTLPVCFWCGEPTGEIAILGAAYKGEAPMHMIVNREPCDTCEGAWALGIVVFEAVEDTREPTGSWSVITEDGASQIFHDNKLKVVLGLRRCMISQASYRQIFSQEEEPQT